MSATTMQKLPLADLLERSYSRRRILITGHNGFVGSWLTSSLLGAGADVTGLSLAPVHGGMYEKLDLDTSVRTVVGDVRDPALVASTVKSCAPEVVFHLAAQALVLPSFDDPIGTLATNMMGTAHVLDALRAVSSVRACVVVTSDKCYAVADGAHDEGDALGGEDPYSASKAGAEIVAHAYRSSFFGLGVPQLATARAGNIVGGGDWSAHRIVPDCVRAALAGESVHLRRPEAIRPWQHVLDAVAGYLRLGDALINAPGSFAEAWNFGPPPEAAATVGDVARLFADRWRSLGDTSVCNPVVPVCSHPAERASLTLLSAKAQRRLGWNQYLDLGTTMDWTTDWYHKVATGSPGAAKEVTAHQMRSYLERDAVACEVSLEPDALTSSGARPPERS